MGDFGHFFSVFFLSSLGDQLLVPSTDAIVCQNCVVLRLITTFMINIPSNTRLPRIGAKGKFSFSANFFGPWGGSFWGNLGHMEHVKWNIRDF